MSRHVQLKKAQESVLSKSHQLTSQVSTFSQTENELRGQLNVYVEKFKQVRYSLPALRLVVGTTHFATVVSKGN